MLESVTFESVKKKKNYPLRRLKALNVTFQMSGGKSDWTSNWNCHLPEWARAKLFLLWVGKCIKIVHTKFRDPTPVDEKLWSQQHSKAGCRKIAFSAKKSKLWSFFGAIFFHLGSWNFMCILPKHISNHWKFFFALSHPGRWQFQHSRELLHFF